DVYERLIQKLQSLTAPMVREAARKYLKPEALTLMVIHPQAAPAAQPIAGDSPVVTTQMSQDAPPVEFPQDYPKQPPFASPILPVATKAVQEIQIAGMTAFVLNDAGASTVEWNSLFPRGWQDDPRGKEGLGRITAVKPPIPLARRRCRRHISRR